MSASRSLPTRNQFISQVLDFPRALLILTHDDGDPVAIPASGCEDDTQTSVLAATTSVGVQCE
eukprot:6080676-Amphidinium_carterae.1